MKVRPFEITALLAALFLLFGNSVAQTETGAYSESAAYVPREIPRPWIKEKKNKKNKTKEPILTVAEKAFTIPLSAFDADGNFVSGLQKKRF